MVNYETIEDLEQFNEELEYLRKHSIMSPIAAAKVAYLRKKNRNQREVDIIEYKYRFKFWQKLYEKEWTDLNWGERENESLYDFAHGFLIQHINAEKEEQKTR